jgi:hypothetical protein
MGHARVGDTIKIIGLNGADWVMVGKEYYVESVSEGYVRTEDSDDSEMVYELRDVHSSWCGEPRHFEIVHRKRVAKVHPKYDTFRKGNTVRRWRDVEGWEWDSIGEVGLPDIGDDVEIEYIDIGNDHKEDSFYSKERQYWYPMKAFVLAEYYHHTITNRGTAELNTDYNGESKITSSSGIEVQRVAPSIVSRERTSRSGVQSRGNATIVRGRYSSHKAITGK